MSDLLLPRLAAPDDREALRVGADVLTYRELARAGAAHLRRLAEVGVTAGARVGVWTDNDPVTPVVLAAHAAAGIVSVPLNPKLGPRERGHILGDARPTLLVGTAAARGRADDVPFLEARVDPSGPDGLDVAPPDDAPVLILYTSGTTGPPKGAVLTRRNVAFDLDGLAEAWGWSALDTVVHALPLFHVHGLVLGLLGSLRVGGTLCWTPPFDPLRVARELGRGQSMLFSVPTMIHRLADAGEADHRVADGLRAARLLISGSAGLPRREHQRIEDLTGRGVLERYGLTETLINCAVPASAGPRPGTVGPALSGIELRQVDEARQPLGVQDGRTLGEVAVRGPNVFAGYLDRPEATAAVLDADGWFYTGDLAAQDPDGAIRIAGRRATDLIKTGGYKVGAGEVEAAILEHPAVAEAAVIGAPDDDLGERIVAFVVLRPGGTVDAGTLTDLVATELTPHKRPREVRFVTSLPRNPMGKVLKPTLRERLG
ncbi:MAG: AMP-binding protein [Sandaracinaceae bacterium]